ncbi:MAG: hypothetical protein V7K38_01530 [Nostoc sp.]|uniref:hypothetical protein n=1 Tax=Nostoc sp. TaxID=1180 RepID=UPI002FFA4CCC
MINPESEPCLRFYQPLPIITQREETQAILSHGSFDELMVLPLALGEHYPDWKYAQDVCLKLANHADDRIRANACLGLAYVARTQGKLEKHLVKPVILRELRSQTEWRWRIEDAIADINNYLGWRLAQARLGK